MTHKRLAEYVEHELNDARIHKMWSEVDRRRKSGEQKRTRNRIAGWGAVAVAAGVLIGFGLQGSFAPDGPVANNSPRAVVQSSTEAPPTQGSTLSATEETMAVDLVDGSKISLAPRSRLALKTIQEKEMRLALGQGAVTCDVTKDEKRDFFVMAGPVQVRVVGTKFSVVRRPVSEGEVISVTVERGEVEVSGPDRATKSLSQGESWSVLIPSQENEPVEQAEESEPEEAAKAEPAPRPESANQLGPSRSGPAGAHSTPNETPDLFDQARTARRSGNAAAAAKLYEAFLGSARGDARAGVAALELARLKMDHLGDVSGAVPWLQRAAQLGAGGLGDDALARLTQAYARLGNQSACKKARLRYLKSYPSGVHVHQVESLCP